MGEKKKQKVYLETSFVIYLTGRATTRELIASWQASSRQSRTRRARKRALLRDRKTPRRDNRTTLATATRRSATAGYPCGGSRPMGRGTCDEVVRLAETGGRAAKRSQESVRTRRAGARAEKSARQFATLLTEDQILV